MATRPAIIRPPIYRSPKVDPRLKRQALVKALAQRLTLLLANVSQGGALTNMPATGRVPTSPPAPIFPGSASIPPRLRPSAPASVPPPPRNPMQGPSRPVLGPTLLG